MQNIRSGTAWLCTTACISSFVCACQTHGQGAVQSATQENSSPALASSAEPAPKAGSRFLCETGIHPNRQRPKQSAQNIFPLSHPGHRFDVQRMQSKHTRKDRACPRHSGKPPEQQKGQNGICRMQDDVCQVRSRGSGSEPLHIQHITTAR